MRSGTRYKPAVLRLIVAVLAIGLALSAARAPRGAPLLALRSRAVPLHPDDLGQERVGGLRYRGGIELVALDPRFGGLSDLRVTEKGRRLVAVSDCGFALVARLHYDERGNLSGASSAQMTALTAPGGRPLRGGEEDAESLVLAPDGAFIGFVANGQPRRVPITGGASLVLAIHHLGPVGAGSGAKIVNNGVMHALMVVLIEAGAMAKKLGIPMTTLVEILGRPDGIRRPLEHRVRERMLDGNYAGGMSVMNARKDSMLALETAQDYGVPLFATLAAHTPYEIAQQKGMGELDYASLAKLWEEWCDLDFADK